mmetsp:Transcript_59757/g.142181  ORF Transcript_59757/g.142181 Transcript_59757/m.142181 type:complete len:289 (+) Transcript_59757:232-1098(+)
MSRTLAKSSLECNALTSLSLNLLVEYHNELTLMLFFISGFCLLHPRVLGLLQLSPSQQKAKAVHFAKVAEVSGDENSIGPEAQAEERPKPSAAAERQGAATALQRVRRRSLRQLLQLSTAGRQKELVVWPDGCTSVLLRNVPVNLCVDEVLAIVHDNGFYGEVAIIFLPPDMQNKGQNAGYVFLEFRSTAACSQFRSEFHQELAVAKFFAGSSESVCEVAPFRVQGYDRNLRRLRCRRGLPSLLRQEQWLPRVVDVGGMAIPLKLATQPQAQPLRRLASGSSMSESSS